MRIWRENKLLLLEVSCKAFLMTLKINIIYVFEDELNGILLGDWRTKGYKVENEFGWNGMLMGGILGN